MNALCLALEMSIHFILFFNLDCNMYINYSFTNLNDNYRPLALTSKRPSWGTTSKFRCPTERIIDGNSIVYKCKIKSKEKLYS